MPSNGSSAHTQLEYSVVVVAVAVAAGAAAAAAVVVGATAAAVFSHATLSFKCPCVRYNAARTQPGHFTCHFPRLHPRLRLHSTACPAPRQLWILMAAASHVESPSSVAAAHSRHTPHSFRPWWWCHALQHAFVMALRPASTSLSLSLPASSPF